MLVSIFHTFFPFSPRLVQPLTSSRRDVTHICWLFFLPLQHRPQSAPIKHKVLFSLVDVVMPPTFRYTGSNNNESRTVSCQARSPEKLCRTSVKAVYLTGKHWTPPGEVHLSDHFPLSFSNFSPHTVSFKKMLRLEWNRETFPLYYLNCCRP